MNDILPPKRPITNQPARPTQQPPARPVGTMPFAQRPAVTQRAAVPTASAPPASPVSPPKPVKLPRVVPKKDETLLEAPKAPVLLEPPKKKRSVKKIVGWCIGVLIIVLLFAVGWAVLWYDDALRPVTKDESDKIRVEIKDGSSPDQIGQLLEEKKLIRSSLAFDIYTRLSDTRSKLQAGVYTLSPTESTEDIVAHIASGKIDQFSITFLPGATLAENRQGLISAGYSAAEVDAALEKTYDLPLFQDKPASADLEGYIYGETYTFPGNATVEEVLTGTFKEFYSKLTENNLIAEFKKHDLNLYQAITLASIIQREVPTAEDQKQVAQVFYTRLDKGMELGSDVTYQYAAEKFGLERTPELDSPYNTRKYPGLPPGPIATPGLTALQAVAAPATGDYIYFLSGDDDKTYFSRTDEEHEAAIRDHCQVKCSVL